MARFLEPQEIVDALRGAGLTVIEPDGWRGRCRCCTGPHTNAGGHIREWVTLNGITIHHTSGGMLRGGAAVAYASRGGWLTTGDAKTPGPLCLAGIDGDGRIIMVGAGRCNHIGKISSSGLAAMRAANFSLDGSQNLRGSDLDGNGYTLGFELMAGGVPNDVQRDAAIRAAAALCRRLGWTGQEVHGHGEVADSRDFSDPGFDMGRFRRDVMAAVRGNQTPPPRQETPVTTPDIGGRIGQRWAELGGPRSILGNPAGNEVRTDTGAYRPFERGFMIWSNDTDAHVSLGLIREAYARHDFEHGHLGYPISDEFPIEGGIGQHYQNGSIYYRLGDPQAYAVYGAIRTVWASLRWETGPLGYPTSDEFDIADGRGVPGRVQRFQGGTVWHSERGTWPVWGLMLEQYAAQGWERGPWGFPGGPENKVGDDYYQGFAGGIFKVTAARPPAQVQAAPMAPSKFVRPIRDAARFPITMAYRVPGDWAAGFHPGVDIGCPIGTPVYATISGDVRTAARGGWGPDYGNHVIISDDEPDGSDWGYCHLSRVVVREGQHVETGQLIGYSGDTGRTFGAHLHLERRKRGTGYAASNFRNPNQWP
ncbi:peptidoglycan DD-metalloendopeptidase family protein [Naumannella sp. ID2617S]|nr:peptidoglycan DD-metalloendopeptidase family protein [Naumannella sp. ID2617S]